MKQNAPKRYRTHLCIILFCLTFALTASASPSRPQGFRIAAASDLHFDPDHTDKMADPSAAAYNSELVDALLYDVKSQGAEILLLTGDIVNGGKSHKHKALAKKLSQAEKSGLCIYVLPGNHDLAPIGQQEFASYYAGCGSIQPRHCIPQLLYHAR